MEKGIPFEIVNRLIPKIQLKKRIILSIIKLITMKTTKTQKSLLVLLFALASLSAMAQQRPLSVGVSTHFINLTPDQYFPSEFWQIGIAKVSLGIPLSDRWSLSPAFAFGNAKTSISMGKSSYWDADLSLQYALTQTKLQPYISVGGGANHFNDNTYGTINAGLGLNYWITNGFALTAHTSFDATPSFTNYWHNSIGLAFKFKGGPKDSDKDGIPDDQDACPTVKGVATAQGCPDADGDGIKDSDDLCPKEKGTAAAKGCPDSDGDGIANAQDECPTEAGKAELKGCPDRDGDGIADKNDACPTEKGTAQFNGCPDTDGDGIADKDDKCPTERGTAASQGCPDRDGDGVVDSQDSCPDQAGTAANKGCPEIKAEEVKQIETKLNMAAKMIQFETGKAVIRPVSYKEIDEIVSIMNQYGQTRFSISGHTDNTGNAANNKTLSDQRATAVKEYIVSKGIAVNRLDAAGFGSDKPIATNATPAGRAQNRRVEIHLAQ
jgi:OmpA-OmpF porin, OOP family